MKGRCSMWQTQDPVNHNISSQIGCRLINRTKRPKPSPTYLYILNRTVVAYVTFGDISSRREGVGCDVQDGPATAISNRDISDRNY